MGKFIPSSEVVKLGNVKACSVNALAWLAPCSAGHHHILAAQYSFAGTKVEFPDLQPDFQP
jgi:hypothetical protein